ncbi:methylglyoxal synthase [Fuchsiella alkaliacetigena]|nr:methylglyoxal synthase [Fuchsiella alkaliacetigena]MCK8824017.1 methylglyoxal synthase [Fuchsiella alkaliacetigena]
MIRVALIAHDEKKDDLIKFIKEKEEVFKELDLVATGTTGKLINEETDLNVTRMASGPLGGDQQIGAKISRGELDAILFLRDPLTAQPHEPDVSALLRVCDVHNIPLATNLATANMILSFLQRESL